MTKYNITVEQYETMVAKFNGACYICKQPPEAKGLVIDHCHATGKVRGLLCMKCNVALGAMRDNPDYLQAAIEYLKP